MKTAVRNLAAPALLVLFLGASAPPEAPASSPGTITAQEEDGEERLQMKVRRLLDLIGASQMSQQVMQQMMDQFEQMPTLPEGFSERFMELADPDTLIDMTVEIYMRHLDEATIDATITFAESPAGRKLYGAQPAIMQESMEVGMRWGQELAAEVMKELGY